MNKLIYKNEDPHSLFICNDPISSLKVNSKTTFNWIAKFENVVNKNSSKTIKESCTSHQPYWYSLNPKTADIFISINPYERLFFSSSNKPIAIDQRLIGIKVIDKKDIEIIHALLNSILSLITIELKGVSRNLGALDLNSNFLKELKFLDPKLLTKGAVKNIVCSFKPLTLRNIMPISQELKQKDRKSFDKIVFKSYGFDIKELPSLYSLLNELISNRITLSKNK